MMSASGSNSTSEGSSSDSTQREDGENREATRPAGESPGSVQVERSVAVVPELEATESRYQTGLARILSKVASDPVAVYRAVADLRGLIEETVRREIGLLRKEMDAGFKVVEAKIESLESRFTMVCWMLGAVITLLVALVASHVALFVFVINMELSRDRSGTPLPPQPSATVQAPARTETVPPTGAVPDREGPAIAAPGGTAVTADPPADQTTP